MALPLSVLAKLRALIAKTAPEQVVPISEALRQTARTGLEHSVVGLSNEGGQSYVTRGTNSAVRPNAFDMKAAKRAPGNPAIIDFHTHPGEGMSTFEAAPSRQDFEFYAKEWPSGVGRDLHSMIAVPPNRVPGGERRQTAYNYFLTQDPAKVFDPRALDNARFELQRAGSKGRFSALQDDPLLREYFDYGGSMGELLEDASPLAMLRYRVSQGLGKHEFDLGNRPFTQDPDATASELFRRLENPAVEFLRAKGFKRGGLAQMKECSCHG